MDDVTSLPERVLDELTGLVQDARSMPMSASCVVHRGDVLALLAQLRDALPEALHEARGLLADRAAVVDDGRREAARIAAQAHEQRALLLAGTDLVGEARAEAERVLQEARASAEALRAEVEDYVDAKLATFEIVLSKTLTAVGRGREKLAGRHDLEALAGTDTGEQGQALP